MQEQLILWLTFELSDLCSTCYTLARNSVFLKGHLAKNPLKAVIISKSIKPYRVRYGFLSFLRMYCNKNERSQEHSCQHREPWKKGKTNQAGMFLALSFAGRGCSTPGTGSCPGSPLSPYLGEAAGHCPLAPARRRVRLGRASQPRDFIQLGRGAEITSQWSLKHPSAHREQRRTRRGQRHCPAGARFGVEKQLFG